MILLSYTPYYIAERTNACLPSFSTIDFTNDSFTIKTYDYNGNRYADDFTITKKGISTLLDKTIYSQVAEGQQAQSDDYTADKAPFIAATLCEFSDYSVKFFILLIEITYGSENFFQL